MIDPGYYDKRLKFLKEKLKEEQGQLGKHQITVKSIKKEIEACKGAMNHLDTDLPDDDIEDTNNTTEYQGDLLKDFESSQVNELSEKYDKLFQKYTKLQEAYNEQLVTLAEYESQLKNQQSNLNKISHLKNRINDLQKLNQRKNGKINRLEKKLERKWNHTGLKLEKTQTQLKKTKNQLKEREAQLNDAKRIKSKDKIKDSMKQTLQKKVRGPIYLETSKYLERELQWICERLNECPKKTVTVPFLKECINPPIQPVMDGNDCIKVEHGWFMI